MPPKQKSERKAGEAADDAGDNRGSGAGNGSGNSNGGNTGVSHQRRPHAQRKSSSQQSMPSKPADQLAASRQSRQSDSTGKITGITTTGSQALQYTQPQLQQQQQQQQRPVESTSGATADNGGGGDPTGAENAKPKKKRHRAGKKHRARRQSFAAPSDISQTAGQAAEEPALDTVVERQERSSFYRLDNRAAGSDTSLESGALLDHRDQNRSPLRTRRQSIQKHLQIPRSGQTHLRTPPQLIHRASDQSGTYLSRSPRPRSVHMSDDEDEDDNNDDDRTPLISARPSRSQHTYGGTGADRRQSNGSGTSSRKRFLPRQMSTQSITEDYDVNNPPSLPGSPRLGGADEDYDDVMLPEYGRSPEMGRRSNVNSWTGEAVIDIDQPHHGGQTPQSPGGLNFPPRRRQTGISSMEDVCLPFEQMTEIGEEDYMQQQEHERGPRRHRKVWPDLSVLEQWSQDEKEVRTMEGVRAMKVDEPVLIGGRLRPQRGAWRREVEDAPFRWTYFNEEQESSLRSHTISGLEQLGLSFRELFIPEAPELEDSSSDEDDDGSIMMAPDRTMTPVNGGGPTSRVPTRQSSILDNNKPSSSGEQTPAKGPLNGNAKPKRYGPRPVFWLDVLQPTWEEMRVLSRAFGIHKLTAEDIMEQEAREKVELFRNYYFVNYRTFEQDEKSEDYLDPVNMYFVVFKGGVISFHFSQLPHPPNVRRRIRQLAEHQYTDSDWIAYAIIDNITDAYAPLIEQIEQEVDSIDDDILLLHSRADVDEKGRRKSSDDSNNNNNVSADAGRDMLLRVGECRKRVMGLYRLLGNKADVIKGLAKRCNEQWQVAPRSDVGLYLGDIQDHIVTMTGNLTHYESILSRAHSNYLAQINIGMNERAEKTNDVLGKLTVLGTIVLPMNIVTGMWGMNCLVPGQVDENPTLYWFFGLTTFLILFGLTSFFIAKKVYMIV